MPIIAKAATKPVRDGKHFWKRAALSDGRKKRILLITTNYVERLRASAAHPLLLYRTGFKLYIKMTYTKRKEAASAASLLLEVLGEYVWFQNEGEYIKTRAVLRCPKQHRPRPEPGS